MHLFAVVLWSPLLQQAVAVVLLVGLLVAALVVRVYMKLLTQVAPHTRWAMTKLAHLFLMPVYREYCIAVELRPMPLTHHLYLPDFAMKPVLLLDKSQILCQFIAV